MQMDRVVRALMNYAEHEIAPMFAGNALKEVMVGAALEFYVRGKLPAIAESMGVVQDGQVDVNMLLDILERQMEKHPEGIEMALRLNPLQRNEVDVVRIRRRDVDTLRGYIARESE